MLISCKSCAAVNFIQVNRKSGDAHCTICRKVLDLSGPETPRDPKQGFRISQPVELEKRIEQLNPKQRLSLAASFRDEEEDYELVEIEDEEEELLDMTPSMKLPALDLAQWMGTPRISALPASTRRERLNHRLSIAAWVFVAGLGTAGAAGAAVVSAKTVTTTKQSATAALAAIAPPQATTNAAQGSARR